MVAVHGIVDSLYQRELASKTRRGLVGQHERGFHTGGSTFGYRSMPVADPGGRRDANGNVVLQGKRREVHEGEAVIVRRIFESYAAGVGIPRLVNQLNAEGVPGPRGGRWSFSSLQRLLRNERLTGKAIWGQRRHERRPGSRQKVTRPIPRSEWRIAERPELRIVSDELWNAVAQRRELVAAVAQAVRSRADARAQRRAAFTAPLQWIHALRMLRGGDERRVSGGAGITSLRLPTAFPQWPDRVRKPVDDSCQGR